MEINKADVAELVDARDLKSRAATDIVQYSCKTADKEPNELTAAPCRLQNRFELIDKNGHVMGPYDSAAAACLVAACLWPDQEQDEDRTGKGWDIQVVGA